VVEGHLLGHVRSIWKPSRLRGVNGLERYAGPRVELCEVAHALPIFAALCFQASLLDARVKKKPRAEMQGVVWE